ncbi:hypothetical protein SKAU_G00311590 [Synaphobranchus kaupii]|uniref:Uncharacterized protein n=1 Tax=Synaphobranchus kaupii TaxID=118154 RepID=A0A9Q1ERS2_SYNKA|nr:hypothetical protein SKAU_G00311590 [Synaphobranchus kaupii]
MTTKPERGWGSGTCTRRRCSMPGTAPWSLKLQEARAQGLGKEKQGLQKPLGELQPRVVTVVCTLQRHYGFREQWESHKGSSASRWRSPVLKEWESHKGSETGQPAARQCARSGKVQTRHV